MIRMIAFAAALFIAAWQPIGAKAQTAEETQAIEGVIRDQLAAIQGDDWNLAFSFASPNIQRIFDNPDNFSQMVKRGYPMVWRPKSVQVGDLVATENGPRQTILFEDDKGRFYVADYFMQLVDGVWRINGVQIRPAEAGTA